MRWGLGTLPTMILGTQIYNPPTLRYSFTCNRGEGNPQP